MRETTFPFDPFMQSPTMAPTPEAPTVRVRGLKLLAVIVQFALLMWLIRAFQLENRAFYNVMLLAAGGFVIHALLPLRFRLPWFALLSVASLILVFGLAGFWILGVGIVLIAVCHLPVRFSFRVALVIAISVVLVASRAQWMRVGIPDHVWPILGSMFMFRLALYLHSLKHGDVPSSPARAFAYFFMLPNVCFPLYPVVDYATFARQHFGAEQFATYETGIRWMLRGAIHLLLYRVVYHQIVLDPSNVRDLGDLTRYMLGGFLLYLRVSGQFHLIIGLLHLFGFRLPETHRLYYLAASFTDFWRRINIYWKDFMMKLVYYPSFFWLRRFSPAGALTGATILVFVATWALHAYQWFWLRGDFPVTAPDILFWATLGMLVVIATKRESARARTKRVPANGWSLKLGLKTMATFITITFLWSLWSSESLAEWLDVLGAATTVNGRQALLLAGGLIGGVVVAGRNWGADRRAGVSVDGAPILPYLRAASRRALLLGGLLVLSSPLVRSQSDTLPGRVVASINSSGLNAREAGMQQQGYYEALNNVNRVGTQLWEVYSRGGERVWFNLGETRAYRRRDDFILTDMNPSVHIERVGKHFTTNRWGMRDQEYDLDPSPGTYRVAILGPSLVLGFGVSDGEPYEAILEERLNRERQSPRYQRYELLNFGYEGHGPLQQLAVLEDRVLQFQPNTVVFTIHPNEGKATERHLWRIVSAGIPIPYAPIRRLVDSLGLTKEMPRAAFVRRLRPHVDSILVWSIGELANRIRAAGATPVLIGARMPTEQWPSLEGFYATARSLRVPVIDLTQVYGDGDESRYRLADYDNHPNAAAHRLIADRLLLELQAMDEVLQLGLTPVRVGAVP